ncbi:MAG: ADP-forming succinate--CoA ligase subunit beta [Alphaproteobacteria bacterium]
MYVHEFQAKQLLSGYGVLVPRGALARSPEAARDAAQEIGGDAWAVKAQILAGGRGKAGGIKIAESLDAVAAASRELLGTTLVTEQTGAAGRKIASVYVEERVAAARELYLATLVDRASGRVAFLTSAEGGEDIEEAVAGDPARIDKLVVDPATGPDDADLRKAAAGLGLDGAAAEAAVALMAGLYKAFLELDASLIEINPLALTETGALRAVDVKLNLDDNALFRHPELEALRDPDDLDPTEMEAARYEINYVKLGGDIGCMVNGAGLALATLDAIGRAGGAAADFMDVRPVATREQIATGFRLVLNNPKVKTILVNVFGGGILRCDTMAEGIAAAVRAHGLEVPLIVRAAGTNMEIAKKVLVGQGIPVTFADDMDEAAEMAVRAAKSGAARSGAAGSG